MAKQLKPTLLSPLSVAFHKRGPRLTDEMSTWSTWHARHAPNWPKGRTPVPHGLDLVQYSQRHMHLYESFALRPSHLNIHRNDTRAAAATYGRNRAGERRAQVVRVRPSVLSVRLSIHPPARSDFTGISSASVSCCMCGRMQIYALMCIMIDTYAHLSRYLRLAGVHPRHPLAPLHATQNQPPTIPKAWCLLPGREFLISGHMHLLVLEQVFNNRSNTDLSAA